MEEHLDALLAALQNLSPERISGIRATISEIQRLAAVHFRKEEEVFYPKMRPVAADLLASLDLQHEEVRELERHLTESLADPPDPPDARWLNELRALGIEFHDRIQHHIVDEEDQLFRLAANHLTREDHEGLVKAMQDCAL
jgi:hemerythrin-like domain-containing protein